MFSFPISYSTLSISSYPPFTIPRLQTNRNYCADQVLSVSTSAYALVGRFRSCSAGRSIAVWQLENFDQSLQDVIFTYGGTKVTAVSHQTQQKG